MLLFQDDLSREINSLLMNENRLRIAVAFVGDGASQRINPNAEDVKIICNLTMNGTNPAEVQKLINRFGPKNIKQIDNLHAKLYIGSEYAIVGSANLSANGLGTQPTALREAGYKFKLDQPSGTRGIDWFGDLWKSAHPITEKNLQDAAEKWNSRDSARVSESENIIKNNTEKLSELWESDSPCLKDYIFCFYYNPRCLEGVADEVDNKCKKTYGDSIDYFYEGCYKTEKDANAHRDKILNYLNLSPEGRLVLCIYELNSKNPKSNKFRFDESFVGVIKNFVVEENSSGEFQVLSLYEEVDNPPVKIDENFINLLSSAYKDSIKYPNFNKFINGKLLESQDQYCYYQQLKDALK